MSAPKRVIKKYPNRRLYDTDISAYVTLEEIKALVLKGISFDVIDSRTNENLTNSVLLQIIMELEQKGAPIFTTTVLEQFIRFYGHDMQTAFSTFLEKSVALPNVSPPNFLRELSAQQMQLWENMQKQWEMFFSEKNQ